MLRTILIVAVAAGLAGCVSSAAREQEDAKMDADRAECATKYKSGQVKGYAGYMHCINQAEAPMLARLGRVGYGDIGSVRAAGRVAIAERVDRGEITPAQADFEIAQLNSNLYQTARARLNSDRVAASATSSSSAPTFQPIQIRPTYQSPPSISCRTTPNLGGYRFGTTTNCQ